MSGLLFTEEERMLQQTVRDFARREIAPRALEVDERDEFAWDYFQGIARLGLMGITIPPEYGGSGGGYKQIAIAIEELTRGDPSASLIYLAHLSLTAATIERFGSHAQKERFVPPLARGERVGAWCLTEPASGSDAANFQTIVKPRDGGYIMNGTKTFITNGDVAETFVVFATLEGSARHRGTMAFVIDRGDTPGLVATPQKGKMGMRGSSTAEVSLQECFVSRECLLGGEEQGFKIAMSILDSSRISIAAQSVGVAAEALDIAARYAKQRHAFGQPVADFQGIQWMLADMATEVEASRLLTYQAAEFKDADLPHGTTSAMAKLFASQTAMKVATQAVQIHGGYGYFRPHPIEKLFRDAKVLEIYEGTSQIQRVVISRNFLREVQV